MDVTFRYFDIFLIALLLALVTLILSTIFKRKVVLISVIIVLITGMLMIWNQLQYTTFSKLYAKQLDEQTVVNSVSIYLLDDEGLRTKRLVLEEQHLFEPILEDFSAVEIKEADASPRYVLDYQIEIVVTNQLKDDHFSTSVIRFEVDEDYLDDYQIISETNHLQTIDSLVFNDQMDWKDYN